MNTTPASNTTAYRLIIIRTNSTIIEEQTTKKHSRRESTATPNSIKNMIKMNTTTNMVATLNTTTATYTNIIYQIQQNKEQYRKNKYNKQIPTTY